MVGRVFWRRVGFFFFFFFFLPPRLTPMVDACACRSLAFGQRCQRRFQQLVHPHLRLAFLLSLCKPIRRVPFRLPRSLRHLSVQTPRRFVTSPPSHTHTRTHTHTHTPTHRHCCFCLFFFNGGHFRHVKTKIDGVSRRVRIQSFSSQMFFFCLSFGFYLFFFLSFLPGIGFDGTGLGFFFSFARNLYQEKKIPSNTGRITHNLLHHHHHHHHLLLLLGFVLRLFSLL